MIVIAGTSRETADKERTTSQPDQSRHRFFCDVQIISVCMEPIPLTSIRTEPSSQGFRTELQSNRLSLEFAAIRRGHSQNVLPCPARNEEDRSCGFGAAPQLSAVYYEMPRERLRGGLVRKRRGGCQQVGEQTTAPDWFRHRGRWGTEA